MECLMERHLGDSFSRVFSDNGLVLVLEWYNLMKETKRKMEKP